jgi:hydroxymethylbilane synthase
MSAAIETGSRHAGKSESTLLHVGTRGSPLALIQARGFMRALGEAFPDIAPRLREQVISTTGDAVQDRPLADIGGKGLFAKEIHEALLDQRIDFAVHSLKDLETELPRGIVLACVLKREDPRDALIFGDRLPEGEGLAALPRGAVVGTSSVRRQSQLLHARPDLRIEGIRGNVQTRLGKLRSGRYYASTLAVAGLRRLDMELPGMMALDPDVMLPAAGQGIVGITVRASDAAARTMLAAIEDRDARIAATAERSLLTELDGSCRTPIAANATLLPDGRLKLTGMVARADGSFLLTRCLTGRCSDAERMGQTLGTSLMADSPADVFD